MIPPYVGEKESFTLGYKTPSLGKIQEVEMICPKCSVVLSEERSHSPSNTLCPQCVEVPCHVCLQKSPHGLMTETAPLSERVSYTYLVCEACLKPPTLELTAKLLNRISFQKQIMKAAAVEIEEYWVAHCDQDGYGPINLLDYLECKRIPRLPPYSQYHK